MRKGRPRPGAHLRRAPGAFDDGFHLVDREDRNQSDGASPAYLPDVVDGDSMGSGESSALPGVDV